MKKTIIIILSITFLTVFLVSCQSRIVGDTITGGVVGPVDYGETKQERQGIEVITVKEFHIVADTKFTPNILEVNEGDYVRLVIYASTHNHGFVLPAYGINEFLEEDNYKTIEFVADQPGTFTFFSNVYAGPQTKDMSGKLIVNEFEE